MIEKIKKINYINVIQILVGLLFLISGLLKALDAQDFARLISNYGSVWSGYIAPIIAGLEVILGLCLIFQIYPKYTSLVAIIVTLIFTVIFAYGYIFRGIQDCGCMGSLIKIPPSISFPRNIFIIIGCFWIWKQSSSTQINITKIKMWTIYVLSSLTFASAGFTLAEPFIDKNNIKVGENVYENFLIYYSRLLGTGRSFVFIFDTYCVRCWNATENVKSIKRIPEFSNLIGLTLPREDITEYKQKMQPNFQIYKYPTKEIFGIVKNFPVLLLIENGEIKWIFKSDDIPCGPLLKNMLFRQKP